jgi:mono/diheme cytochrome c family protein
MTRKRIGILLGAALAAAGLVFGTATSRARDSSFAQVMRGRYLVYAGDCAACHTADNGAAFAGGRAVPTPFGTIYATNITPDRTTGIGSWTEDDFWNAMHSGMRPDGSHLYPAFPYPWFTKLGRGDVLAIKAYLDTLPPVKQENKAPDLPWPLSWRTSVAGWNTLFFKPGTYKWDPSKSEQWNRGAYLVEGLGHCGACHSPKNTLGAVKTRDAFEGGSGEGWFATSLRPGTTEGLGRWSENDIVEYLKTGANDHARAMGPMAEVVHNSTMHLRDDDLHAIAVYLRDLPAETGNGKPAAPDRDAVERGRLVYVDQCAGCHMENGAGVPGVFPPIKGNAGVHAHDATSLARLVLEGARSATTPQRPEGFAMPGFEDKLSNREIADLLTYIRTSFGNAAAPVAESKVADVRESIRAGD